MIKDGIGGANDSILDYDNKNIERSSIGLIKIGFTKYL
jgi:hypothetical protein